jgi:hypothetical protein
MEFLKGCETRKSFPTKKKFSHLTSLSETFAAHLTPKWFLAAATTRIKAGKSNVKKVI